MSVNLIFQGKTYKESETISDCQDYFKSDETKGCFAIADGASQSFYPSIWAELIVEQFCENPEINQDNWKTWLEDIQQQWLREVKNQVEKAKIEHDPIWVTNQNRLNRFESATSTFIGLQFTENKVKVSIVGDSCLFIAVEQPHSFLYSFESYLLINSSDFGNRPEYFASYSKDNDFPPQFREILLKPKNSPEKLYFILATDALSEYILKCVEQKEKIVNKLVNISSQKEFEDFVKSARNTNTIQMKNDDVALVVLEVTDREISQPLPNSSHSQQAKDTSITKGEHSGDDIPPSDPRDENPEASNLVSSSRDESENPSEKPENSPESQITKLGKQNRSLKNLVFVLGLVVVFLVLLMVIEKINKENQSANNNSPSIPQNQTPEGTKFEEETTIDKDQELIAVTKYKPKFKKLEKGTIIYKDQELKQVLINSLSTSSEVLIIEEGDKWIKFKIDLYAHKSLLNQCNNCAADEIEIKPNDNLRVFPIAQFTQDIFGQLKEQSRFKKLEFSLRPDWDKFRFEGYIKK